LLQADVEKAASAVRDLVKVPLKQGQFDALTSFIYNIGRRNFANSTLLSQLNSGNYQAAADELMKWDKVSAKPLQGLTVRRGAERRLFLGL